MHAMPPKIIEAIDAGDNRKLYSTLKERGDGRKVAVN